MGTCEMCGRADQLVSAEVEGVEMQVCNPCTKYGKIKHKQYVGKSFHPKPVLKEGPELKVRSDFSEILRKARNKSGLTQEEFSKHLNERESEVAKWESGSLKPRIDIARKLGRILEINFLEKDEVVQEKIEFKKNKDEFTLGDFIKVRKRK